jgi:aspartyl/asparaginyl beta-hydroxylase (cupin superfamily)
MTITRKDLDTLYVWAKQTNFPLKKAPTTEGYTNKDIFISWLKGVGKTINIRKKLMTDEVYRIFENEDILYATYSVFTEGTVLKPHRDPNVYREPYKRIQVPLIIPDKEKCYMTWVGEKIYWEEGVVQIYDVMNNVHDGANLSDYPMEFLFVDVKKSAIVEMG